MAIETIEAEKPVIHTQEDENWTMEIKSNPGLLDLNLKELWRYRDLITLIVRRNFVSVYKQTILGPFWHLAEPMVTTLIYALIFGGVVNISTDGLPRILFYLSGIMLWGYFSSSLTGSAGTFNANAGIFGKVYFPRLVMPISTTISGAIAFGMQFFLFLLFVAYYTFKGENIHISAYIWLTPVLLLIIAGMGLGLGMLLTAATRKYKDVSKLVNVSIRLMMFTAPVIYPLSKVPAEYRWIIKFNPMTPIIEAFRFAWLGFGSFSWQALGYSFMFMIVVLIPGIIVFNRVEKNAIDTI